MTVSEGGSKEGATESAMAMGRSCLQQSLEKLEDLMLLHVRGVLLEPLRRHYATHGNGYRDSDKRETNTKPLCMHLF